jgi:hypothetical protein
MRSDRVRKHAELWHLAQKAYISMESAGLRPLGSWRTLKNSLRYFRDWRAYAAQPAPAGFELMIRNMFPLLADREAGAGETSGHYFTQDLWAARRVFIARPSSHVDVGSRIDGFVSHILTFMPVTAVDCRPLPSPPTGLNFIQDDATTLYSLADNSVPSLSSLHAVEHFGLGRYGDTVDPTACDRAMGAFTRILQPGGRLYFSVPIGRQRVEFNAHRVFSPSYVLMRFASLELVSFSVVRESGELVEPANPDDFKDDVYSCGLFEFTKHT